MSRHFATVDWSLKPGEDFARGRYSRAHSLSFDGGVVVPASASPQIVGKWGVEAAVDPEEMLVAALSNCHMLTFLHLARLAGWIITGYVDAAEGVMEDIGDGRRAVTKVWLRPAIAFEGTVPDGDQVHALHHAAHLGCFIANSVKTQVIIEAALT